VNRARRRESSKGGSSSLGRRSRGGCDRLLFLSGRRHLPRLLCYLPLASSATSLFPFLRAQAAGGRAPPHHGPLPSGGRQLPPTDALRLARCCWRRLLFARAICPPAANWCVLQMQIGELLEIVLQQQQQQIQRAPARSRSVLPDEVTQRRGLGFIPCCLHIIGRKSDSK
jgi:hypothetical protein